MSASSGSLHHLQMHLVLASALENLLYNLRCMSSTGVELCGLFHQSEYLAVFLFGVASTRI